MEKYEIIYDRLKRNNETKWNKESFIRDFGDETLESFVNDYEKHKTQINPKLEQMKKEDELLEFQSNFETDMVCGKFTKKDRIVKVCHNGDKEYSIQLYEDQKDIHIEYIEGINMIKKIKNLWLSHQMKEPISVVEIKKQK